MANIKRNAIELVTKYNAEKDEVEETKVYYTPAFIPLKIYYEALDLTDKIDENPEKQTHQELDRELMDFVANRIYKGQFTVDDLMEKLHAPNARRELQSQLFFVASGEQSAQTKKLAEKKG